VSAHGKSFAGRATDALSLAVVFGILYAGVRLAPGLVGEGSRDAALLGAVGFLLLAGTLTSELVEVIGVPHLTGYLLAGIVAGPHVLHLIDHETVKRLEVVNTLAIALIALAGGAELRLDSLKQGSRTLGLSTLLQTVLTLVVGAGVFYAATPGFVREMTPMQIFGVSLLWGVVAITRSPSALLGVLSQTRASGPLARYSLAFIMSSDVVVVMVLATVITIARPLIDPGATMSFEAFRDLGHEVLGSVAMGTTLGLILVVYLKVVGRQLLVVLVALGYGATEVLRYVHFEPLLTFIVAGFVVQNLSKQGDKFLHAIESTGDVVYVLFFAGAGAHLNIPLLKEFWPIALLLTGTRAAATWVANAISMRVRKEDPVLRKWGYAGLVSQAGVALGIAQAIARGFPTFGPAFRDIAIACIAINELVGPVLFKFALDRVKESKAPSASLSDVEEANA
jgi:Kef-type K+ transport system membrane component KefB